MLRILKGSKRFLKFKNHRFVKQMKRFASSDEHLVVSVNVDNTFERDVETRKTFKLMPVAKYGGQNIVTLIFDENTEDLAMCVKDLFKLIHAPVIFDEVSANDPEEVVTSVLRNRIGLGISITHGDSRKSQSIYFNNELDLYACIVNCRSISSFNPILNDINVSIVMQNNTGDFSKLEYEPVKGIVETLKMCHEINIKRVLIAAFQYAKKNKRKRITIAHKSDEIPKTETRFVEIAKQLQSTQFPEIECVPMLVNTVVRKLVMSPLDFDVICCNEKYGTCLMSICSGICANPSLFSASEIGGTHAVFKPLTAKISLNDGKISIYGAIMSGIQLLRYLNQTLCAANLAKSFRKTIMEDKFFTKEFGGTYSNKDVVCRIVENLNNYVCQH